MTLLRVRNTLVRCVVRWNRAAVPADQVNPCYFKRVEQIHRVDGSLKEIPSDPDLLEDQHLEHVADSWVVARICLHMLDQAAVFLFLPPAIVCGRNGCGGSRLKGIESAAADVGGQSHPHP